jgi:hypothetical protein
VPRIGPYEERVRVSCHLPCSKPGEAAAIRAIFRQLYRQRAAKNPVTGFTHSLLRQPTFRGWWFGADRDDPKQKPKWIEDKIVLLIIDYLLDPDSKELDKITDGLQEVLRKAYIDNGRSQTEFWITTQAVARLP